jgi:hypothetical protein
VIDGSTKQEFRSAFFVTLLGPGVVSQPNPSIASAVPFNVLFWSMGVGGSPVSPASTFILGAQERMRGWVTNACHQEKKHKHNAVPDICPVNDTPPSSRQRLIRFRNSSTRKHFILLRVCCRVEERRRRVESKKNDGIIVFSRARAKKISDVDVPSFLLRAPNETKRPCDGGKGHPNHRQIQFEMSHHPAVRLKILVRAFEEGQGEESG